MKCKNSEPARVVQCTWGKFHHFDLARQLHQRGLLEAIFTTYPWGKLTGEGLPRDKVRCRWFRHSLVLGLWRYGLGLGPLEPWWMRHMVKDYERWLSRNLPECDVFIALSGSGLAAGKTVQRRGGAYVCDRGSSHILYSEKLLKEEFSRWGLSFQGSDPAFIALEEKEYAQADCITVPSGFALESFVGAGIPRSKVARIPYGVDTSRFRKVAAPPEDEFRVLFVGQVSLRKGVPYLLEGFKRLRHPKKSLTVIGAMRPEIKQLLDRLPTEGVNFLGAVPQQQLSEHMSRSHAMVLPSIEEGLATVQGQALACGCPLISSTNSGGMDLISDRVEGFIVPIRDADAIADRLEQFAQDPHLRNRMSEAALNRVKTLGGWNAYGQLFQDLISRLATAPRRGT